MTEFVYVKLEFNPAGSFITGVWCDGVYFSAEPPLKATPENEQWARTKTIQLAKYHEDCIAWRLGREIELKRQESAEARYAQYRRDILQEKWAREAYHHLKNCAREELKDENRRLKSVWVKKVQYKAEPSVRDYSRDRKLLYEAVVNKRTYVDIAEEFGISPSRVSQLIYRERSREHRFWVSWYKDHEAEGQIQEPEPEAADQGTGTEWTPEAQYREFELLRGVM